MIQASIYISVFLRYLLSNMFNFDDSIDMLKLLQSCVIFKQRNNHEVSLMKIFGWNFSQLRIQKYPCNSTHSYNKQV